MKTIKDYITESKVDQMGLASAIANAYGDLKEKDIHKYEERYLVDCMFSLLTIMSEETGKYKPIVSEKEMIKTFLQ